MTLSELKKIKEEMSLEHIKLPIGELSALSKKWKENWKIEKEKRDNIKKAGTQVPR